MTRWARILALFAWKRRWVVYDRWAYIWEPVAYKPQAIMVEPQRPAYADLHPMASYSYRGLVVNSTAVSRMALVSI